MNGSKLGRAALVTEASRFAAFAILMAGLGILGALAFGVVSNEAKAYKQYLTKPNDKEESFPLRWWVRPALEFHVSTTEPEETAWANVQGLFETALATWISAPCATSPSPNGEVPEVDFAGSVAESHATTPSSLRASPDNLIVFIRSSAEWARFQNSPTWIAITKIAHDPTTGEIVDADIEVNDGGYTFSYDDTPAPNEVDFLSMLTHETGHFFGLDHSGESDATMFATYATSPADAMNARSLSQDDIDGICDLYTDVPQHRQPSAEDGCAARGGGLGALLALLALAGIRRRWTLRA